MVMKTTKIIHLLTVSFLVMLSACVGKIEEANVPNTTQFVTDPILFSYNGIATANAVSHDKIEITFQKVDGPTTDYSYKLYINDSEVGTEMLLNSLTTHLGGRYYFLVTNLDINSSYKFRVRAFNKKTGAQSKDEASIQAKTFDNVVADFRGIVNLQAVPGQESRAIRVKWDKVPFFIASPTKPNDPVRYEVIYAKLSPAELFNPLSLHRSIKTISPITVAQHPTEADIDDLDANTTYYFTVRAIHRMYGNYLSSGASYIPVDRENNTKFLSFKTNDAEGLPDFNPEKFRAKNALGQSGYTDIETTWARSWGAFYAMKIIYKRSTIDFLEQDFVDIPLKANDQASGIFTVTDPFLTRKTIVGLETGATYKLQLLLCKSPVSDCPIAGTATTRAGRSDTQTIQVKPSLASFMGIISLSNPDNPDFLNEVTINFDPPVTSVGWADGMKFYCVGNNNTQHELSNTTPISHADAGVCNGLTRGEIPPDVSSFNKLKVSGTLLNGSEYCFTGTPYIFNTMGSISAQLNDGQRIKRCITPQILTPTIQQFSGAETIAANQDNRSITLTWNQPTGGIYNRSVVFWKKRLETSNISTFSFNQAVSEYQSTYASTAGNRNTNCGVSNYCFETITTGNTLTTQTGLVTGIHEMGVLSLITNTNSGTTNFFWSQINVKIKNAEILPSKADFKGWTRIFAIGPKKSNLKSDASSQYITEAIDSSGIPYEPTDAIEDIFRQPPGQPLAATFESTQDSDPDNDKINLNSSFDGKRKQGGFGSNSGIVSIAWEDVDFKYTSDNSAFTTPQLDSAQRNATNRKFGYKVFRSEDNRLSWTDITTSDAFMIHSRTHRYRKRPNTNLITSRMAFFTDYSVQNLAPVESPNHLVNGTEQARVYWYKVVPYFNGKPVTLTNPESAVVRVTLPPPNMALVHRWMANRSQCLEMNLTPDIGSGQNLSLYPNKVYNYSCEFTGVGAVQESYPFIQGKTRVDLKADLLVDRHELGCNYTRGPESSSAQETLKSTSWNDLSNVYAAVSQRGCYRYVKPGYTLGANDLNPLPGLISSVTLTTAPTGDNTLKQKLLVGDCIGASYDYSVPRYYCSPQIADLGGYNPDANSLPGYSLKSGVDLPVPNTDCNVFYATKRVGVANSSDNPLTFINHFPVPGDRFSWLKQYAAQSNFLNVYHNTFSGVITAQEPFPSGVTYPNLLVGLSGSNPVVLSASPTEPVTSYASSCSINLAAIDGSNGNGEYIPRWANLNRLTGSYDSSITIDKSRQEIITNNKLYGGGVFTAPAIPSYIPNLPIGKIMTTNNAGAPPLTFVDRTVARKVCELYKVNVVVYQEGKTSYIATNLPKRLLRKREFVASSMWPDIYGTGEIDYLEGIDDAYSRSSSTVGNLFHKQDIKQTVCAHKPNGMGDPTLWSDLPDRLPNNPYFSGSKSTSSCISRYGIQDMVGNVEEPSNDELFCGYSPIGLRFGAVDTGKWDNHFFGGESPEYQPNGGVDEPHVDLNFVSTTWSSNWLLLRKGYKGGNPQYFKISRNDGTTVTNGTFDDENLFRPYIKDNQGAGYCSMADTDVNRRNDSSEISILTTQDIFGDLFFKTLNQQLIKTHASVKDKGSLRYYRDGNGYFLDFGPKHLASAILNRNSLSFPWIFKSGGPDGLTIEAKTGLAASGTEFLDNAFFSTLLGIPLSCGEGPTYNTTCAADQEALVIEEFSDFSYLDTNGSRDPDFPGESGNPHPNIIKNYYVGGSKIENEGLRELSVTQGTVVPPTPGAGANAEGIFSITTGVKLGPSVDQNRIHVSGNDLNSNQIQSIQEPLTNFDAGNPNYPVQYWSVSWQLPRETTLFYTQGGHFNKNTRDDQHNGRFSTRIGRFFGEESGVRCGVSIHEVD